MAAPTAVEVRDLAEDEVERIESREPDGQGFVRAMWQLQCEGSSLLLVAWLGSEPVGSGQLDLRTIPAELKNLNVDHRRRGMGIGSAIIRAAEERVAPSASLAVGVGIDNPRARALYERLGYRGTGRLTTTNYEYVDRAGVRRQASETDELLVKRLT